MHLSYIEYVLVEKNVFFISVQPPLAQLRSSELHTIQRNELAVLPFASHREQTLLVLSNLSNHFVQKSVFFGICKDLIEGTHFEKKCL
jgi:hypothetical protein